MDKQFDELSKSLAESVSRREALQKFGIGLAGALLGVVGLAGKPLPIIARDLARSAIGIANVAPASANMVSIAGSRASAHNVV